MKTFLFLVFVMAVAGQAVEAHNVHLSQAQKEKAQQYTVECQKETGVKPELLLEAKQGKLSDDDALKKFTLCFFKKSGIVDDEGKLNVETALSKLPEGVDKADAKKLLEECRKKTGKDAADTAFAILKCYSQGTKTHVLF
ncbi:B1 protein-like [Galleria mellonella]|uniref:B1 protein-like n=1 Tax=Galleria mellonella TaxID=7137 RepID=A0A6J1WSP4_GALME|nr:B1 protein-like [Galleria mellonella]